MGQGNVRGAISEYQQVRVHTSVEDVSPHRLIQLLMEGALEKITAAKGYMLRKEVANKVAHIDWALNIIEGLQLSLDFEHGGEIAVNLDRLYEYMHRRIIVANLENNTEILDEVSHLMKEIKNGWDAIPAPIKNKSNAELEKEKLQLKP